MSKQASGEGGIRTPGTREGTLVFETSTESSEASKPQELIDSASTVLPSGLPELARNDPELVRLAIAWPSLPAAIKAAIAALLNASGG